MIRTALYIALLVFSFLWLLVAHLKLDAALGLNIDLVKTITGALAGLGMTERGLTVFGWTCLTITALFYLAGLFNIFANAKREPWRMILFTIALFISVIGLAFMKLQSMGLIEGSSLTLIALMVLPFTPALIILPFRVTYAEYLGKRRK